MRTEVERFAAPRRGRRFRDTELLCATGATSIDDLWETILGRPYPFTRGREELAEIERRWPGERDRVLTAAERALAHEIDVLGTGLVELGTPIDWHCDWKTGRRWPLRYGPRIDYTEPHLPSDVKVPWEISRLQWLLPAGQAYMLTGDERFAEGAREVIEDWLRGNPYALGVNWAIAMEPAMRVFSLTWLLYACGRSGAWSDGGFRSRFLRALYLHVDFVDRHIERSEVNGNHYTADAAALAVGGLVLGIAEWVASGWRILEAELPRQIYPDGVGFEASSAYHRLVGELFAVPALLRRAHGLEVDEAYAGRLDVMARFTEAYTGPDGLAPLWGDADDARVLPLGGQDVNDHRSFPAVARSGGQGNAEAAWLLGPAAISEELPAPGSSAFRDGGVYVLRSGRDHIFVDCGPVGLAGRGGHGHNDCLSFEATLDGVRLIRDAGSFVYSASPEWRNRFRSTSFHNTPRVDGEELNRIPQSLWLLENDARPEPLLVEPLRFRGSHTGYLRLPDPVRPIRTVALQPEWHALLVHDRFEAAGEHDLVIPFHVPKWPVPGFALRWRGDWTRSVEEGWLSPSYGVRLPIPRIVFRRSGPVAPLLVVIAPEAVPEDELWAWAEEASP